MGASTGYSLTHYLRNFPLKFYLSGGLIGKDDPVISLYLSPSNSVAMVTFKHLVIGLETEIAVLPDAPPLIGDVIERAPGTRSFTAKLLMRCRRKGSARYIFTPDFSISDLYLNIHSTANIREATVESLLESLHEEPRQVIGSWDEPRPFRWTVLDSGFNVVKGKIGRDVEQLILLGLPEEFCGEVESWVESQHGSLLAIVPVPVACLKWFCEKVPQGDATGFVVLVLSHSVLVGVVQSQEVILLRQYLEDLDFAHREIPILANELNIDDYQIYVWSPETVPAELAENLKGTELNGEALRQIHGRSVEIRRVDGTRVETNGTIPHLLHWLEGRIT
jgi:hypothetical protein